MERCIALLIGFLPELEAIKTLILLNLSFESISALQEMWSRYDKSTQALKARKEDTHKASSPVLQKYMRKLKQRNSYTHELAYADRYEMCIVPTSRLVPRQFALDLSYCEYLKRRAPRPSEDVSEVLHFLFVEKLLPQPKPAGRDVTFPEIIGGINARFVGLQVKEPGTYDLFLRVSAGFNHLHAVRVGSNFILQNGTHRASALLQAGWKSIPCLVRPQIDEQDVGLSPGPGAIPLDRLLSDRPPYLSDYFDETIAPRFTSNPINTCLILADGRLAHCP